MKMRTATRTHGFTESVIREMTRVAQEHGAINLAQGFPDFAAPEVLKEAAAAAIHADINQYAVTWGTPRLRRALAAKYESFYGMAVDEAREITVTCGATEAMASAVLAIVNPGEEVIVFEPYYENYGPDAILCGARPVWVPMPPDGPLDLDQLRAAFNPATRAIIINTPNNPTGRVLTRDELSAIAALCREFDVIAITDEIYEHILYDGVHVPLALIEDMRDRTVTISGASKTFSVTGWRIGTIVAPPDITNAIRKVHDFLTVGAPAPLQEGVAAAMEQLGGEYYDALRRDYQERRDVMYAGLRAAGFRCSPPAGAYYIMADFSDLSERGDVDYAKWLTRGGNGTAGDSGVASVPGSSFFHEHARGRHLIRFAFCKQLPTLQAAAARLAAIARETEPSVTLKP
jgi:aspartate/methionine/tyrosine aminotransferase